MTFENTNTLLYLKSRTLLPRSSNTPREPFTKAKAKLSAFSVSCVSVTPSNSFRRSHYILEDLFNVLLNSLNPWSLTRFWSYFAVILINLKNTIIISCRNQDVWLPGWTLKESRSSNHGSKIHSALQCQYSRMKSMIDQWSECKNIVLDPFLTEIQLR